MGLLLLEVLGALLLAVLIVWWTMFSGRRRGERTDEPVGPPSELDASGPGRGPGDPPPDRRDQ